jgi:very-short-patch-repair endonuclease
MGYTTLQPSPAALWKLVDRQHGVVARGQLLALGFSSKAIKHRIASGRLHPVWRGVYAVGRPQLSRRGRWMAAVLSCGPEAALSHRSAGALWEIGGEESSVIEVSVPGHVTRRRPGITVHRHKGLADAHITRRDGIPVTTPVCTIVDLAGCLPRDELEAAINAADRRDLTDPEALRRALDELPGWPGVGPLRKLLDRRTFTLTDSALERRFLPVVRRAGLARPVTGRYVNGFKVDFCWPELGLIVETDGLRYHRTPAQQATDRRRDQAHAAAGLTVLRFTHAQVAFDPGHVQSTLAAVARRLQAAATR